MCESAEPDAVGRGGVSSALLVRRVLRVLPPIHARRPGVGSNIWAVLGTVPPWETH